MPGCKTKRTIGYVAGRAPRAGCPRRLMLSCSVAATLRVVLCLTVGFSFVSGCGERDEQPEIARKRPTATGTRSTHPKTINKEASGEANTEELERRLKEEEAEKARSSVSHSTKD